MTAPSILADIRSALLGWYAVEQRDFPWRRTRDPYAVMVSEVMLQQTQAARVAERFVRFMTRFPDAPSLAEAPTAAVLAEWSGLGYNRRAICLQRAATYVVAAGWPTDVAGLERLPGIGPYTARAIASLAFGVGVGVVDTNVRRWLLRRLGVADRAATLQALADALAAPGHGSEIAAWTHATMEFGANVCRARAPRCEACPIAGGCPSRGQAASVPVPRQAPLHGSDRAYRGALIRELSSSPGHEVGEETLRHRLTEASARIGPSLADEDWDRIVGGLQADGLLHRSDRRLRLGAATIGP